MSMASVEEWLENIGKIKVVRIESRVFKIEWVKGGDLKSINE